ncbi:MliC family protein [uncultured Sphingomonas sp.]|uniref:MliC family protein n=1 Tax=uncultured Sphingomonas sp. TaxID=158754 RepID=UPI0025CE124D|nr:MliC family protein [uncultured Sphingomonas sp.]
MMRLPLALAAGGLVLMGCSTLPDGRTGLPPMVSQTFQCDNGSRFWARFDNRDDSALLRFDGDLELRLAGQPVASGIHYAGFGHDLRGKGGEVVLTRPTGDALRCTALQGGSRAQ